MASSPKLLTSILLLSLLFIQIHARDSKYFFSKVPNNVDNFDTKETQIPNNNVDPLTNPEKTTTTPQDQEPNFIPQTQENSYGLYGHESGQLPLIPTKNSPAVAAPLPPPPTTTITTTETTSFLITSPSQKISTTATTRTTTTRTRILKIATQSRTRIRFTTTRIFTTIDNKGFKTPAFREMITPQLLYTTKENTTISTATTIIMRIMWCDKG